MELAPRNIRRPNNRTAGVIRTAVQEDAFTDITAVGQRTARARLTPVETASVNDRASADRTPCLFAKRHGNGTATDEIAILDHCVHRTDEINTTQADEYQVLKSRPLATTTEREGADFRRLAAWLPTDRDGSVRTSIRVQSEHMSVSVKQPLFGHGRELLRIHRHRLTVRRENDLEILPQTAFVVNRRRNGIKQILLVRHRHHTTKGL